MHVNQTSKRAARTLLRSLFPALFVIASATGCAFTSSEGDAEATEDAFGARVDASKPPAVVTVPVYFTKNRLEDVGYYFANSTLPFTKNVRGQFNPMDWGNQIGAARKLAAYYQPGQIGAGYITAKLRITIPRATDGRWAYSVAKVDLDREYIDANLVDASFYRHSPLRLRTGSDQPCLSVVLSGGLEGKMSTHDLPWYDEGFTERDWTSGSRDKNGRPIKRVIVGTFWLSPIGFAEKVDGATRASGGIGAAGGSFMINLDRTAGEASGTRATVHVNLVENDLGQISIGEVFSTSGTLLTETDKRKYDQRARAFIDEFMRQAECWAAHPLKPRRPDGKCVQ